MSRVGKQKSNINSGWTEKDEKSLVFHDIFGQHLSSRLQYVNTIWPILGIFLKIINFVHQNKRNLGMNFWFQIRWQGTELRRISQKYGKLWKMPIFFAARTNFVHMQMCLERLRKENKLSLYASKNDYAYFEVGELSLFLDFWCRYFFHQVDSLPLNTGHINTLTEDCRSHFSE
jgi:hypothetical protein